MTIVQAVATTAITRFINTGSTSYTAYMPNGSPATLLNVSAVTTRLSMSAIADGTNAKLANTSIAATFTSTLIGA